MDEQTNVTPQQQEAPPITPQVIKKAHRTATRSPLLFPVYGFGEALRIAEKVETAGGGKLEEHTLAIALGMSVKSSGFSLRTLTAKQFKLLQKSGSMLETTQLAKAIIKPINEEEKIHAMKESFLSIPLFNAVATRFKGQPFPQSEVFRNILERELRIPHERVMAAERVLLDSAREAKVMATSGTNTYLNVDTTQTKATSKPVEGIQAETGIENEEQTTPQNRMPEREIPKRSANDLLTVSPIDLAEFNGDEFDEVWTAIGKIVKNRGKRMLEQEDKK